jgi:serine-type D-Ala-D-Ala carboxypeptidase/endopeptidase (penicillin-binding protein 4)
VGAIAVTAMIAGCGGGGHAPTPSSDASVGTPVPHSTSAPSTTPVAPRPLAAPPALVRIRASLTSAFHNAGPDSGALVYDLTAKQTLFAVRPDVGRPPASVEKLYTTVALLSELGPNEHLTTTLLGAGHLGPGGVWHGDLYLRGGGDPTLGDGRFNRDWEQGFGPTANQLVGQLGERGIRKVTGQVIGDGTLFDPLRGGPATAYGPDVPDFGGQLAGLTYDHGSTSKGLSPPAFAAKELVLTMHGAHIKAKAAKRTGPAPPHAQTLATVQSPPLSVLLKLMDVPSDDFFAEMLTKQLGVRFGSGGSIQAGAHVISQVIESFGLHPNIVDGSGLSRDDRSSPGQVVALLRTMWNTPIGQALQASLPVVGVNGTVQRIAAHTFAQGRCVAKTGTLNFVTNLAGYCTARDRHVLAFALMIDARPNWTATQLLNRMVPAIARY